MYDVLAEGVEEVVLAHPKRVKAIAAARIKNDKIDAGMLARLARADLVPASYAPPPEIRELRDLVRHRARPVRERTRHCPQGTRDQLSDTHQLLLDNYLAMIDAVEKRLKPVNKAIRALAKTDPRAKLLMTMPGIGFTRQPLSWPRSAT